MSNCKQIKMWTADTSVNKASRLGGMNDDDLFFVTSLGSKCTGLPFLVCVRSINFGATGNELPIWIGSHTLLPSEMTHLTFGSEVRLIKGSISDNNLNELRSWVALNLKVLQEH